MMYKFYSDIVTYWHYYYNKLLYVSLSLVNECDSDNGGCEGTCMDTITSFECQCDSGYILASDGLSCEGT